VVTSFGCDGKKEDPSHYSGEQLHFGQGGGFTGDVNYFILLDDGRLFEKGDQDSTYILREQWKKAFTRQMFANYHTLRLQDEDHRHPGNLFYFIEFHAPDQPTHLISWGQQGYAPAAHIVALYQTLYKSTRSKS